MRLFLIALFIHEICSFDMMANNKYFDIIIDRFEIFFESPEIAEYHVKIRKVNKTRKIYGYVTILKPLGDNVMIGGLMLKKQGGEYRLLPYRIEKEPFCQFCKNDKYVYQSLAKNSDFPTDVDANCPLKPGNFTFYGATIDSDNVPKVALQSGDYAFDYLFYKGEEVVAHYRFYCAINNI